MHGKTFRPHISGLPLGGSLSNEVTPVCIHSDWSQGYCSMLVVILISLMLVGDLFLITYHCTIHSILLLYYHIDISHTCHTYVHLDLKRLSDQIGESIQYRFVIHT